MKKILDDKVVEGARDYLISKGINAHAEEGWLFVTIKGYHILVDDLQVELMYETYNELKLEKL
jgi:hypothetical protein